jgi:hypothetical protein
MSGWFGFEDSDGIQAFVPCLPEAACSGGELVECPGVAGFEDMNLCSPTADGFEGFQGGRCATIDGGADANYYRFGEDCKRCPDAPWPHILLVLGCLVLIGFFVIIFRVAVNNGDMRSVVLFINFMQILTVMSAIPLKWPSYVKSVLVWTSIFSVNLQLVGLECSFVGSSYMSRWFATESLPVLFNFLFICMGVVMWSWHRYRKSRLEEWMMMKDRLIAGVILTWEMFYLPVTVNTFKAFDCHAHTRSDGESLGKWLDAQPAVRCWDDSHMLYVWIAAACTTLFVVGVPLTIIITLARQRRAIFALKRGAKWTASMKIIVRRYGPVFWRFNKRSFLWLGAIFIRSFLFACVSVFMTRPPLLQTLALLVVFQITLAWHMRVWCVS